MVDSIPGKKREKKQGSSSEPKSSYTLSESWGAFLDRRWVYQLQAKGLPLQPKPEINDLQLRARAAGYLPVEGWEQWIRRNLAAPPPISRAHSPTPVSPALPDRCEGRTRRVAFHANVLGWCSPACRAVGSMSLNLSKGAFNPRRRKTPPDPDHPIADFTSHLYMIST